MNRLRKIINNNKVAVAFLLVLFFLTAGLSKSFVSAISLNIKKETATHNTLSKHALTSTDGEGASLSFLDQLKDTDSNDGEFAFFGNYYNPQFLPVVAKEHKFSEFVAYNNIYSGQLYDLYCNWKFHLS